MVNVSGFVDRLAEPEPKVYGELRHVEIMAVSSVTGTCEVTIPAEGTTRTSIHNCPCLVPHANHLPMVGEYWWAFWIEGAVPLIIGPCHPATYIANRGL